ncbi:MAG: hypothetical protein F6K19_20975 [Cyanothece sp. SIO1E1]|nr:hypothetical protein [Cyanothece sp. SIO1E1]
MSFATGTLNNFPSLGQLVPAEVKARIKSDDKNFPSKPNVYGSTVDREGLVNNYALDPKMSYAPENAPEQKFRESIIYAIVTGALLALAVWVS